MLLRIVCICVAVAAPAHAQNRDGRSETFVTSDRCIACHSSLHTASGEDVSIGYDWRATIMANSARDPYWQAAVRRELTDHPASQAAIEDKCATCHMPMARFDAAARGERGSVFANIDYGAAAHREAFDGVSCTICHQITAANLGTQASFDGGFEIERGRELGSRAIYGPQSVESGHESVMRSAARFVPTQSAHIQQSELCATCHTLFTTALDERGETIGELPEQMPYQEWLQSEYRETRSCQSCHMPEVAEETPISSVLGVPRPRLSQHTFRGGNAFMLGILNKYRGELGTAALPQELDTAQRETRAYLGSAAAQLTIESAALRGSELEMSLHVESTTGHKLPTAYPARRVWLHVRVTDASGALLFESGAPRADGSITGNDNDEDPLRFEPHRDRIESQEQVQIYESVMVDRDGRVTTGLLRGMRYVKDNRLLPLGFDKGAAGAEVAVHGEAAGDDDFGGGGDRVNYRVNLSARPARGIEIEATLLYQSIGYRWAKNLDVYDGAEPRRFARYYSESAADSAITLASARTRVAVR
jgi:hypothetical protein